LLTVVDLVLQMALGVAVTASVLRWDMRRLPPERYARAWNRASFWSAVVGFGPLSLVVHFIRTRRSPAGVALGLGSALAVLLVLGTVAEVTSLVVGSGSP
jgi:hypothetical protein